MSIPPLVCSTPPPPDQCEDDKDPEDFDVRYDLSQEDEDESNNYDFRNFSSYSHYQSHTTKKTEVASKTLEKDECEKIDTINDYHTEIEKSCEENDIAFGTTKEIKFKLEEDTNIEDLDLKVDDESIQTSLKENCSEILENEVDSPVKDNSTDIPDINKEFTQENENLQLSQSSQCENHTIELVPDPVIVSETEILEESKLNEKEIHEDKCENIAIDTGESNTEIHSENLEIQRDLNTTDDEFGDFDDFQCISPANDCVAAIDSCDNPWDNENIDNSDFGDFAANFDNSESNPDKDNLLIIKQSLENNQSQIEASPSSLEDDDFGDFDDFKSSAINDTHNIPHTESELCEQVPVLNLQSSENDIQVIDSINRVLFSIFEHELAEPDSEFDVKLESLLSETWGHLMEADVRQPYIVNWNNSFGQKTLLKALCIDSRNILFAPKWGHNMPKYAATLSTAPLQPQKQQVPSNTSYHENVNSEKHVSKSAIWADPFTANGQEFTYAEALLLDLEHLMATLDQMAHNHSTLKISELLSHACNTDSESAVVETVPTDLDVFEASLSTKPGKIYSSTLSVQPLRQINLPDTHIFTPTDSETPRSKTIHYDSGATVTLPQPITENHSNQAKTSQAIENKIGDDEYWEFHDYKSSSDVNNKQNVASQFVQAIDKISETAASSSELPKPNITYQTQILQPIKMEPIMPTLNWPDPGEVKEVFDDFSDFVSNSTWTNDIQTPISQSENIKKNIQLDKPNECIAEIEMPSEKEAIKTSIGNGLDDDGFDTFQSALPIKNLSVDFDTNNISNDINNASPQNTKPLASSVQIPEYDYSFEKIKNAKSETISFPSVTRPNEALTQNAGFMSNTTDLPNKSSLSLGTHMQSNVLQPIPASSTTPLPHSQQKSGQILQPLTLESFSQINWPSPGIDLQDLSRFNPVETLQSLKSDLSVGGNSKSSPIHNHKSIVNNQAADEDVWGEFVSIKPKQQQPTTKKQPTFGDDDEWTDFVSSPSVKPQNGLNTISLNVHTNLNMQKTTNQTKMSTRSNQASVDFPTLNYVTPKSNNHKAFSDKHFQNL